MLLLHCQLYPQIFTLKKKNIRTDIPKKLFIDLRPLAFQRCLDNLINNAFFYSKGKVILEATLLEESFIIFASIAVLSIVMGIPIQIPSLIWIILRMKLFVLT